ncbi:unnamed protein product [Darwinula stevensoni]|uniref:Uncharacterized protein n=1 Tax=Darwinula stevensoni TaxID=69355 RepID=A0A7R8X325_9CRUS|nr:unnamed protein product [Darwinula stevensoni]CAG0884538.1 unnamed protein product [Darwinula stevensoni]
MDTPLVFAEFVPIVALVVLTFILIEAAGSADFKSLDKINQSQFFSARISQRTNLFIMPMVFASWVVGMLSEYEQNLPLYGTFSVMNGVLGGMVFFFHCMGNQVCLMIAIMAQMVESLQSDVSAAQSQTPTTSLGISHNSHFTLQPHNQCEITSF